MEIEKEQEGKNELGSPRFLTKLDLHSLNLPDNSDKRRIR